MERTKTSMNSLRYDKSHIIVFVIVLIGLIVIFSFSMGNVAAANNSSIYVSTQGNDSWDGLNSSYVSGTNGPKATIKNATGTLSSNGTIYLANGVYKENNITINNNMTIIGESQQNTIINGEHKNTIFFITSGVNFSISNLTLTNGTSNNNGGAIGNYNIDYSEFGILTVNNCNFINNTALGSYGGAIYNGNGDTLIINNSSFTNNTANYGGGAVCNENGILIVTESTFTNNTVPDGGGAIVNYNNSTVSECIFTNNTAGTAGNGGAIGNFFGSMTITGSTFNGNNAPYGLGGAIANEYAKLTVNSSIFTNNTANINGWGGAIYNSYTSLTVNSSTFTNNTADEGGAIENYLGTSLNLTRNTFVDNTANEGGAILSFDSYNNDVANVNFNRIFGNIASKGSAIYFSGGAFNATNNWWGSNTNPSGNVYDSHVYGGFVTISPWLVMTVTSNPTSILNFSTSTITVDLSHDNFGNLENDNAPDGIIVELASTLGTIGSFSIITNGMTQSILNSDSKLGSAEISATIDDQTLKTYVEVESIVPTVSASLAGGLFNSAQNVVLTMSEDGTIYYTTDGTTPTTSSAKYNAPISISTTTTLKYLAIDFNENKSIIYTDTYIIDMIPPKVNSINPSNGMKLNITNKVINVIFSEPIQAGSMYNSISVTNISGVIPLTLNINGNVLTLTPTSNYIDGNYIVNIPVKAVTDEVGNGLASVFSSNFIIDTIPPIAKEDPKGGLFKTAQNVVLTMNEDGTIYYTTDGTTPTTSSAKYNAPISISTTTTLKYLAIDLASNQSPLYTDSYVIDTIPPTSIANPIGGLYNSTQNVVLTMSEDGTIYYTTDKTIPTFNSNRYISPISISTSTTLKYLAIDLAGNQSPLYTDSYVIDTIPPTSIANPIGGLYNSTQNVVLTMSEDGTIYYTTDGTTPTTSSAKYNAPISISTTTTLKYLAIDLAGNKAFFNGVYTIIPAVIANPPGGYYNSTQNVVLTMSEDGTIYYTTDGTTPTTSSAKYNAPISISTNTTLKYLAIDLAGNKAFFNGVYTIIPAVIANPPGGYYNSMKSVSFIISQPGTIYYTTDGTTPTTSSAKYNAPISISTTTTLKYLAIDLASNQSPLYTDSYVIDTIPPTSITNQNSGLYNTNEVVYLSMSEPGTIYYTLDGNAPTITSAEYSGPITLSSTSTLKYLAMDLAGNLSPLYTQIYTIDKVPPKVSSTYPKNKSTKKSRTATITLKFNEKFKTSIYWSKIVVKNKYGKAVRISKSISGTTIYIKTSSKRSANSWYTVSIPKSAIKDYAGNNLAATYTFKFKTG